jgi:hypothetical protein
VKPSNKLFWVCLISCAVALSPHAEAKIPSARTCVLALVCTGVGAVGGVVTSLCLPTLQAIRTGFVDLETQTQVQELQSTQVFLAESLQESCRQLVRKADYRLSDEERYLLEMKPETCSLAEIELLLDFHWRLLDQESTGR